MPRWIRGREFGFDAPHHVEGPFGPSETRTAGVMTMRQQVERLRAASIVQGAWKRAHFPSESEVRNDFVPPGYNPTELDIIDEARRVLNAKATTLAEARKQKADEGSYGEEPVKPEPEGEPAP